MFPLRNCTTCLLAVALAATLFAAPPPTIAQVPSSAPVDVQKIVAARGLEAEGESLRKDPRWQPRKVVVALPPTLSSLVPKYETRLREAAGDDVELVLDRSGRFSPAPDLLKGADAVIGYCNRETLEAAGDSLYWLHSYFVGVDGCLDVEDALLAGRTFTNTQRLSAPAIAEHSIAMLLSLARGLPAYHRAQMEQSWDPGIAGEERFGELSDKTLLVVGLGGIGTEVARRAHGLGMRVIATRNSSREGPDFVDYVGLADELGKLSAEAHVIVNALPLTEATTDLFDAEFFAGARPGAIFISVGRGGSTVTEDLIAALASGQLYGAGLDVTDPEPLPAESLLWRMPRVIITPHISASGGDSLRRTALIAAENLRRYVHGDALLNLVDMERGY